MERQEKVSLRLQGVKEDQQEQAGQHERAQDHRLLGQAEVQRRFFR